MTFTINHDGCSKEVLVDKFVRDPNKTPDSSQRPPQDCVKCGNPVEGPSCQGCALWRKKLKEVWFTICHENGIYQDLLNTSESSDDNTNVVNAPQEPFVVKQDPGENSSQSPPQINHNCCYECGDSLDGIFCQRCTCKSCGKGAHIGYNCPPKVPIIYNPEPCNQTIDELPQTLPSFDPTCYSEKENSLPYVSKPNFVDDSPNVFNLPPQPPIYSCESCGNDARYGHYCTPQKEEEKKIAKEQAAKARYWKIPVCYDDDDDEESSIPLKDIISGLPPCVAITPDSPKTNSLIMEDEHLSTIPETESDEFIKSSVENLVQILSESEDSFEGECDLPLYDDSSKNHDLTFSNPLFDINDDCTLSNDVSFSEEDVPRENFKFFYNPLFDLDEEIVSTKNLCLIEILRLILLLDEFAGEIHLVERLLYDNSSPRPPKDSNSDVSDAITESFSPSPIPVEDSDSIMEEIDLFLTLDDSMPPGIETDDYDSEGDILFLEELLSNDSPSLPENESFHFDIPSSPRPPTKPPDDGIYFEPDTRILTVKVVGNISEHHVLTPRLLPTQPTLASNEEKSHHFSSHRGFKASKIFHCKSLMIASDFEASRAHGFVLRSLEIQSFA
ncbi:hypothetical protein Tco_0840954 [Tanacetum coccineum]|uniref:CCHC-type domain-containing protein n=1 Tax=Tanacetum coccineum TaxID=301880 RepID=A0ABQ5AYH4_9ASTR